MGRSKCCKKKVVKFFATEKKTKEYVSKPSRNKGVIPDGSLEGWEYHSRGYPMDPDPESEKTPPQPRKPRNPNLRPTPEDIQRLTNKEVEILIDLNWVDWIKSGECMRQKIVAPEDVPEDFKFVQPVKLFRVVEPDDEDKRDDVIEGVTELICDNGMPGSSVGFKCFNYGIPTIHYLTKGARFWIIIKREGNSAFETLIRRYYSEKQASPGCIGQRTILFSPSALRKHGIPFETDVQTATYSILLYPGVYYGWINLLDDTTSIVTHFATTLWFQWAKEREKDRCDCREKEEDKARARSKCKVKPKSCKLDFFKMDAWMAYETYSQHKKQDKPKVNGVRAESDDDDWSTNATLTQTPLLSEGCDTDSESDDDEQNTLGDMERVPPLPHD